MGFCPEIIGGNHMTELNRISAVEAREKTNSKEALLVCIYDDAKFNDFAHLEGAIPLSEFEKYLPDMDKDQEVIFY